MARKRLTVRGYLDSLESLSKKQLMLMLLRKRQDETEGVAVVGMACRLPGGITGPDDFWAALTEGRAVPAETYGVPVDSLGRPRWNVAAPDLAPLAGRLTHGAYLDDVDVFDAEYFGVSEDEAPYLDPQQRILMTCAAEAVADANLTRAQLGDRRVGVFTAATSIEYHQVYLRNGVEPRHLSRHVASGGTLSGTAGRVATGLGLRGPAMTVDTACSSALTALHLACAALRRRECDLAVVGACHLLLSPWTTAAFAQTGVLSGSGRCLPFAADADGYVRAEGCGVVVLQRQRDAVADGASPYALVRGTAVHQHGERLGMSVASALSQQFVMEEALRQAQVAPEDVAYVEAHANGLKLATVVEVEATAAAYRRTVAGAPQLYVGSCKANLGYLETASGIAGLIKAVLAVRHGAVPPQPEFGDIDPDGGWHRIPVTVPRHAAAWPDLPRRLAGVSAFGFTGTDAHAVVEAAVDRAAPAGPADRAGPADSARPVPAVLAMSAHNPLALRVTAAALLTRLAEEPHWTSEAVCRTLAVGRDARKVRVATVVHDRDGLVAQLSRVSDEPDPPPAARATGLALTFGDAADSDPSAGALPVPTGLWPRLERYAAVLRHPDGPDVADPTGLAEALAADRPTWTFAWVSAWISLVRDLRLNLAQVEFGKGHSPLLADVVTHRRTPEQACRLWRDGDRDDDAGRAVPVRLGRWRTTLTADGRVLRRAGVSPADAVLDPARIRPEDWLSLVAGQFAAGVPVRLDALWDRPRDGLVRLPPPAMTGSSYWPEQNRWS